MRLWLNNYRTTLAADFTPASDPAPVLTDDLVDWLNDQYTDYGAQPLSLAQLHGQILPIVITTPDNAHRAILQAKIRMAVSGEVVTINWVFDWLDDFTPRVYPEGSNVFCSVTAMDMVHIAERQLLVTMDSASSSLPGCQYFAADDFNEPDEASSHYYIEPFGPDWDAWGAFGTPRRFLRWSIVCEQPAGDFQLGTDAAIIKNPDGTDFVCDIDDFGALTHALIDLVYYGGMSVPVVEKILYANLATPEPLPDFEEVE